MKDKIISGAIHYFRVVPEYWRDRLEKLKMLGCNTVETYVPWNMHEPQKGQFCFDGILDIEHFLSIAQEVGLQVIVRPAPYICAEWEFGGLPYWLLTEEGMEVRSCNDAFLACMDRYFDALLPKLVPFQESHGGPIVLMQVENEYGAYGSDKNYMRYMAKAMRKRGIDVPLVTSDGTWDDYMKNGCIPDMAMPTANFGSKAEEHFKILREFNPDGPLMCMEFWVGWFDAWGDEIHHTGSVEEHCKDLDYILSNGNVNIYMFHGGTNFGFMNGSNYYEHLAPDVTSYDYDALLTEDGKITPKYNAFQQVISKYTDIEPITLSTEIKKKSYGTLSLVNKVSLFSVLSDIAGVVESKYPKSMEECGQGYGYILYRTILEQGRHEVKVTGAADRLRMFLNGESAATLYDKETEQPVALHSESEGTLDILLENMGRVNYGPNMRHQKKGIVGKVLVDGQEQTGFVEYTLPLTNVEKVDFSKEWEEKTPAFYLFEFEAEEIGDTFLDTEGFGKGCAFINGFNLGRFWQIGPQRRLYVPGPLIQKGKNQIILFETEGIWIDEIKLEKEPDLGEIENE